ncbi:MAG TPA: hypothetical protein VE955_04540 [Candidatus Dormibacteraeota bacterium]|jgi:hypothetical protein|nr:hypothetical protein [Candidatus Dormibacteraeota bacterium]
MAEFERLYLPESMATFTELSSQGVKEFVSDDNRGAVLPTPSLEIDGTDFYLSVKGVGTTTNPFSHQPLTKAEICSLVKDPGLRERILDSKETAPRYITGELWLRGSPYGGQGLQHANVSMKVSEMADLTTIHGFRIAPLVKIVLLPEGIEGQIKKLHWYRRFGGRIVQETRLVPSNIRIYFHSGSTVGDNVGSIFDLFEIDTNSKALDFLKNFVKSGIAFLTLFTRTIERNEDGTFSGLDFYDVWLDKDAVLAPDGTIYFVDLEGLERITVKREKVREKIDDQIYRSLYEFLYAYEQIERERAARYGDKMERKAQLEILLREALVKDEIVDLARDGESTQLVIGNILRDSSIIEKFPIIDW